MDLSGQNAVVFGVANQRSIGWAIAQALDRAGARLVLTYQNDRLLDNVRKLANSLSTRAILVECDVSDDANVETMFKGLAEEIGHVEVLIHSIAFADRDDLGGRFVDTGREGFRRALDISAYSLVSVTRHCTPLMTDNGGSILTLSFQASSRVFPGYNIMGTAKAALENEVRQLAFDLGRDGIRVNAVSAGPLDTLSSRVISKYRDMKTVHAERSPLGRNITHQEVADTALFLCSPMASGITGEILHVDSGYHVMGI
ncbi:enoyl-ACP reductase [Dehalococcoidia bacterium]|nr:enoyl-ACP reductase [Dehalococcoidia bacterium]